MKSVKSSTFSLMVLATTSPHFDKFYIFLSVWFFSKHCVVLRLQNLKSLLMTKIFYLYIPMLLWYLAWLTRLIPLAKIMSWSGRIFRLEEILVKNGLKFLAFFFFFHFLWFHSFQSTLSLKNQQFCLKGRFELFPESYFVVQWFPSRLA